MSYKDRCSLLKWPTLEKRRECLSLVEYYMSFFGLNNLTFDNVFEYTKYSRTRASHKYKLNLKARHVIVINILFFIRIISTWNCLPQTIVKADNLQQFKSRLKCFMDIQIFIIYYRILILYFVNSIFIYCLCQGIVKQG